MSDADYARLCQTCYSQATGDDFAFDHGEVNGLHVVCFRGTKTPVEWLQDFLAFPLFPIRTVADLRLGLIHAGFLEGAVKLMPGVAATVQGRRFALTGHSLGGALASVCAGFLAVSGNPPVEVVTFGAPRAGMDALADVLHSVPIRQYRYRADPVPHLPTDPPFRHVREPLLQLGRAIGWVFADHHITHYISALEISDGAEAERPLATG